MTKITAGWDLAAWSPIPATFHHVLLWVESRSWTDRGTGLLSYVTPDPEKTLQGRQSQGGWLSASQRDLAGM